MLPLVLIPGIQGRWEYMRPTVDALSAHFDAVTFSLEDSTTLDGYVSQVADVLAARRIERAVICGVSFGGVVALRFAAVHPERVLALVLASTPAPGWHLKRRHDFYARLPRIFGPLFLVESPWRMRDEITAALPNRQRRRQFKRSVLKTAWAAPISFKAMAGRARLMQSIDLRPDCARITSPTLVITGDAVLDHVVPAHGSSEYARLITGARAAVLERTGHLGSVTRPEAFAALIAGFVRDSIGSVGSQTFAQPDVQHHPGAA
ncbi:MAG TPA: alpha/beta hydrolase [Vicinamibacterales bacterium]